MDANELLEHMDTVFTNALIKTRDERLAEDLTQETYLQALLALSKGVKISSPNALYNQGRICKREKFLTFSKKDFRKPYLKFLYYEGIKSAS